MGTIEEIKSIKQDIDDLFKVTYEYNNKIREKSKELLNNVLSCKVVFNETVWVLQNDRTLYSKDTEHKLLAKFLQNDHHCHFENDDLILSFSDWDIYLYFKKPDGLMGFVQKHQIILDIEHLLKHKKELKNEIEQSQLNLEKLEEEITKINKLNNNIF